MVDSFIKALKVDCETLNIGSGIGTRLSDLASLVIKLTNSLSKLKIVKGSDKEVSRYTADVSKANRLLSWTSKTSLKETIEGIILKTRF